MFDELKNITVRMRSKELAEDYRFISEPDLPIIKIDKERIEKIKKSLPETPAEKVKNLVKKHKLEKKYAEILTKKLGIVEFFEKVAEKINPKIVAPWVTIELLRVLNYNKKDIDDVSIKVEHFAELLSLVDRKEITELKAKEILNQFVPKSFSPREKIKSHGKISSEKDIDKIATKVIKENPKAVSDFKSGKKESLNFLIGQVMKLSEKRADFKKAREILIRLLR